ncbi:MAG: class I SAM-dependent methyltransferase [Brucellaceae bacterium]|nr:class I SAM-dependent methyltransferase [Brucellaceae bacterium]
MLDIGCGTGVPAIVLARDFRRAHVDGYIDVRAATAGCARRNASTRAGVSGRIKFVGSEPAPCPSSEPAFDIVFSKDSLIHIPDKQALYAEVPLQSAEARAAGSRRNVGWPATMPLPTRTLPHYLELSHLDFAMATAAETATILRRRASPTSPPRPQQHGMCGRFPPTRSTCRSRGRCASRSSMSPARRPYAHWLQVRRMLAKSVANGSLRPTHLRGRKP